MLKWLLTLLVAIFVLGICAPHLARFIRFGRLPGDLSLRFRGRDYSFPFASTVILSLILFLVSRFL